MNKQKGFTLIELLGTFVFIVAIVTICISVYVAYHFISKFW